MMTKTIQEKLYNQSRPRSKKGNQDQSARLKLYIKNQLKSCWVLTTLWPNFRTKSTLLMTSMNNKKRRFWEKLETSIRRSLIKSILQHQSWLISTRCHKVTEARPWNGVNSMLTNKSKSTINYWRMSLIRNSILGNSLRDSIISSQPKSWMKFWTKAKREPINPVWKEVNAPPVEIKSDKWSNLFILF